MSTTLQISLICYIFSLIMIMQLTSDKKKAGFWVIILIISAIIQYRIPYTPEKDMKANSEMQFDDKNGYVFTDQENELINIKDATSNPQYLELVSKFASKDYFKITENQTQYVYWGDLDKSIPEGKGIIMQEVKDSMYDKSIFIPLYVGNFKGGKYSGFGKLFTYIDDYNFSDNEFKMGQYGLYYKEYEGYFKNGEYNGIGNFYIDLTSIDEDKYVQKYIQENHNALTKMEGDISEESTFFIISDLPPMYNFLTYYGEYENGEMNGTGTGIFNGVVLYKGDMKDSTFNGEGTSYYENGSIMYEGMFKNGKYNGKGTRYNSDGSVDYSGEWKNGDIK